jgi:hypothetical protein
MRNSTKTTEPILTVYLAKTFEATGVIQDEIVKIGDDRFKSLKFRHTYYRSSDFKYTFEDMKQYIFEKYNQIVHSQMFGL